MDSTGVRQRFQRAFMGLSIAYGILVICVWACFGLTLIFLKDTGTGYHGILAGMGGMTIGLLANCANVARLVTSMSYKCMFGGRCSPYSGVCFIAWYPLLLIVVGLCEIALASVFGIGYKDRVAEADQKNADENFAMGIINVIVGCFFVLVSVFTFNQGQLLKAEIDRARVNEGAFAPGPGEMDGKI